MEKRYVVVIFLVAILSLVFSIFTTDNILTQNININIKNIDKEIDNTYYHIKDNYYISRYGKIDIDDWDMIDNKKSGFRNSKDFLTVIDNYVTEIVEFIRMPDWEKRHRDQYRYDYYFEPIIEFSIVNSKDKVSDVDYYMKLRVLLSKDIFEKNFTTLPRDITQIIARKSSSDSLTEGLGFYIQDKLGSNINKLNYGIDIFTVSKYYISENLESIITKIGTTYGNIALDNKEAFFILSNSFCTFLIENYGIENFMEVYKSEIVEDAYIDIYGLTIGELKLAWVEYLANSDSYMMLSKEYLTNKKLIKTIGTQKSIEETDGSVENKTFFILHKSFEEYLIHQFGRDKYDSLIDSNYDYQGIYGINLTELKNLWLQYVKGLQ